MQKNTFSVPALALAVSADSADSSSDSDSAADSDSVMPQVGDTVEFTVSGTVSAIENGVAQIEPDSVNGQPMNGAGDGSNANTASNMNDAGAGASADMESHLRQLAARADDEETP